MENQSPLDQELLDRAQFGRVVELFWGSQLGSYLQTRARECYTTAIQDLKDCDPTDSKAVMKAQNAARVADQFESWLTEAVIDGAKALELLDAEDDQ